MEKVDLNEAHNELMSELFEERREGRVTRSAYTKALIKVQDKYGLKQGHPDFLGWIMTCIGNSPELVEDEEGGGYHDGADPIR